MHLAHGMSRSWLQWDDVSLNYVYDGKHIYVPVAVVLILVTVVKCMYPQGVCRILKKLYTSCKEHGHNEQNQ